ncbi:hypothetical protein SLEP1_g23347 [Rubroshorea leprosula]|uniref:Uncharacterized protein n=1 Tax=Rubroshorea leprosula TaxID=152421 RepID=A0AAV5JLB3_9ROSI|nr:hypothetical protein SLEP1_g23347 [Rubroshorea leprosula]
MGSWDTAFGHIENRDCKFSDRLLWYLEMHLGMLAAFAFSYAASLPCLQAAVGRINKALLPLGPPNIPVWC